MPLIQGSIIEGRSAEQKETLIRRLIEVACEVLDSQPGRCGSSSPRARRSIGALQVNRCMQNVCAMGRVSAHRADFHQGWVETRVVWLSAGKV